MDLGLHLPLMQVGGQELSLERLAKAVDAARACDFAAVAANDHFVFQAPWLDGPTALASEIGRSGDMALATTVSLPVLRGPVALAKTLAGLDLLCGGRLVAALGPGSSRRDYEAVAHCRLRAGRCPRWARTETPRPACPACRRDPSCRAGPPPRPCPRPSRTAGSRPRCPGLRRGGSGRAGRECPPAARPPRPRPSARRYGRHRRR